MLKGAQVLDALASCHTVAFDKTGTLTTGGLTCKAIEPIYGHHGGNNPSVITCCVPNCEKEALAVAAAMEKGTTHPIGRYFININCCINLTISNSRNMQCLSIFLQISHITIFFLFFDKK